MGVSSPPNVDVKIQLMDVRNFWDSTHLLFDEKEVDLEKIQELGVGNMKLLSQMNEAVNMYEQASK